MTATLTRTPEADAHAPLARDVDRSLGDGAAARAAAIRSACAPVTALGILTIEQVAAEARALLDRLAAIEPALGDASATLTHLTLHHYRKKRVVPAPLGSATKGTYGSVHVLATAFARASGHLGVTTLSQAADQAAIAGISGPTFINFLVDLLQGPESPAPDAPPAAPPAHSPAVSVAVTVANSAVIGWEVAPGMTLLVQTAHPAITADRGEDVALAAARAIAQVLTAAGLGVSA